MSSPALARADVARHAAFEFVLTTTLLFVVVGLVRWLAHPASPLAIADPAVLFAVAGALVAVLIAGLMYSPLGRRSGGHMHPGVTLFVWLGGALPGSAVVPYVVAQLAGSVAGAGLARLVFGPAVEQVGYAAVGSTLGGLGLFLAEALPVALIFVVVSFFLPRPETARFVPVVIGVGVGLTIAFLASTSGASVNPARQLGPALFAGRVDGLWIYLVAPVLAPVVVALVLRVVRRSVPAPGA
ncbi:aquaporin [Umezawaea endophytica]|uniref:Aquaporin n=1 Tax=Umezawaea endophytica TaxID=1654476 RepID=A0A9X2VW13_9PSEU|nr:aquaporin [Umezawaea endophytica]MCS7483985.1 aquaporin [Umezawaea endophytica]